MTYDQIEQCARDIQMDVWKKSGCPKLKSSADFVALFTPQAACASLGLAYSEAESLGNFGMRGEQFEVAGTINRRAKEIFVSSRFGPDIRRFTAAHELGHWLLHEGEVMHRDRPIRGVSDESSPRSLHEREADYFAACYLMPRKGVKAVFEYHLGTAPFVFDDVSAFRVSAHDYSSLLRPVEGSLDRELALSTLETLDGQHFISLAKQFKVSPLTMAIRLRELRLVA